MLAIRIQSKYIYYICIKCRIVSHRIASYITSNWLVSENAHTYTNSYLPIVGLMSDSVFRAVTIIYHKINVQITWKSHFNKGTRTHTQTHDKFVLVSYSNIHFGSVAIPMAYLFAYWKIVFFLLMLNLFWPFWENERIKIDFTDEICRNLRLINLVFLFSN